MGIAGCCACAARGQAAAAPPIDVMKSRRFIGRPGASRLGRPGGKGLRQRLNNYLHARSSFTLKYLDGQGARLRNRYKFNCVVVRNPRLRALLESYAMSAPGLHCRAAEATRHVAPAQAPRRRGQKNHMFSRRARVPHRPGIGRGPRSVPRFRDQFWLLCCVSTLASFAAC